MGRQRRCVVWCGVCVCMHVRACVHVCVRACVRACGVLCIVCYVSMQIPQYLHEAGWTGNGFMVGITQPRRVAATTVSCTCVCMYIRTCVCTCTHNNYYAHVHVRCGTCHVNAGGDKSSR